MPIGPTVLAHLACLTIERLRDAKVPTDPILKEVALTRSQTSDHEGRIPFHKHVALLEVAARELRDPCYGLHLGQSLSLKDFDLLGYICLNSATLGDALNNVKRYSRVYSEGFDHTIVREGDTAAIVAEVLDTNSHSLPQSVELVVSLNQSQMSVLLGYEVGVVAFELAHKQVGPKSEYSKVLKAPVRFNAGRTATIIHADLLDAPILTADQKLLDILKRHAEDVLGRRLGGDNIRHMVRSLIASRLQSGKISIDDTARELGMSSRTLARRLHADGVTYRDLLNDLRRQLALRYLNDGFHSYAQIAYLLGFADVSAFSHAFKRWTGSPPSRYLSA